MSDEPLDGHRVVVTRSNHQADQLMDALELAGAEVARLPLLDLAPSPDPEAVETTAARVRDYDWLAFTSSNAVHAFLPFVEPPLRTHIAVVGAATAKSVRAYGFEPVVEAAAPHAEGLADELLKKLAANDETVVTTVLVPQAEDARPDLVERLNAGGVEVTPLVVYSKGLPEEAPETARSLFGFEPIGWVTFTSPRIARHFVEVCQDIWEDRWELRRRELKALSIGPVTSAELRRLGFEPAAEAEKPSVEGLVAALIRAVSSTS